MVNSATQTSKLQQLSQERDRQYALATANVYNKLKTLIQEGKLNNGDYIVLIISGMELLSIFPSLTGYQKKQILIDTIRRLLGEYQLDPQVNQSIILALNVAIPATIDAIHSAANGKFALKIKNKCKTWCCS